MKRWQCLLAALPDFNVTLWNCISSFRFGLRFACALGIHYYHFDNMSIIKLLFAWLVNELFSSLLRAAKPPKNDIILQFDNRHLQINMSSSVGLVVVQSTCIIFRTHNFWQCTFRCTIYVIVWFNASLTQSAYNRLCRGVYITFSLCLSKPFPQLIRRVYVPRGLMIKNIFSPRLFDLIKYQHTRFV